MTSMTYHDSEYEQVIERYLTGDLTKVEREDFEAHYFECDQCFAAVEAARAVQSALRTVRRPKRRNWVPVFAAIAAMVVIALGIVLWRRPATVAHSVPVTSNRFELLARFDPPRYEAAALRGANSAPSSDFREAMEHYSRGDYAGAIPGLQKVDSTQARFYLGVSYLLTGDRVSALAVLRKVIAAGDTPYLEEARFYLAKGLIGGGDIAGARAELRGVAAMHGDLEKQAGELITQLQ